MEKSIGRTNQQLITLILLALVNIFCSVSVSLQAPFYPAEAQKKGATATEYGIVFGSYELTNFLISPVFGRIVRKWGPKRLLEYGLAFSGLAVTTFGFMDLIENRFLFIGTSLLLRIFEALGASAAIVAGFAITAMSFPDSVGTVFATMEAFYGVGFIIGPMFGGLLYDIGGFPLPFFSVGIISCLIALIIIFVIPNLTETGAKSISSQRNVMETLKIPAVLLYATGAAIIASSQGFYTAILEPHLEEFNLTPSNAAFIFIINGGTYSIVTPIVGKIADERCKPIMLLLVSCLIDMVAFTVVGPLPFIPIQSTLVCCIFGLFLSGVACGGSNVATFTGSFEAARAAGFPDDIGTYGILSGIWNSSYALGGFLGPTLAGIFFDLAGFRWASFFVFLNYLIFTTIVCVFMWENKQKEAFLNGKVPIDMAANEFTKLIMPVLKNNTNFA